MPSPNSEKKAAEMFDIPSLYYNAPAWDGSMAAITAHLYIFLMLVVPILGVTAAMAIFINMLQIGPLLTFEPLKPDIKKINPIEGFKKIFSKKNLIEFIKSIIKTFFLGYLLYLVIKGMIDPILKIPFAGINAIFEVLAPIFKIFALNVITAYVIIAVADLFFQRKQHIKDLRMTKDEVKREYKEMEGDPLIKSERKQLHQELAMNDTVQATKKSNVLVTNPEHFAIGIVYEEGFTPIPVVVAKGKDHIAKLMIEVAKENNIPIMRDVFLARSLYDQVEAYNYIPSDLIEPIAAVLKWAREIQSGGPGY